MHYIPSRIISAPSLLVIGGDAHIFASYSPGEDEIRSGDGKTPPAWPRVLRVTPTRGGSSPASPDVAPCFTRSDGFGLADLFIYPRGLARDKTFWLPGDAWKG